MPTIDPKQAVNHVHRLEIGDNIFWLALWVAIATAIVLTITIVMQSNLREAELITKSPDPLASRCAMSGGLQASPQCLVLLAKREN